VSQAFGNTQALRDVSFDVAAGEIHALAGANGAGKSTLIKILAGVHRDYSGTVRLEGKPLEFRGPRDAVAAGIFSIHQELSLVGPMSVADNLALGTPQRMFGLARRKGARVWCQELLKRQQLEIGVDELVEDLPLGQRLLLEIARALSHDSKLLIMDEPTSALQEREAQRLFARLEQLRAEGTSILYISHHMEEIYRLADRVTVLRDGQHVLTRKSADIPQKELVAAIVGPGRSRSASAAPTEQSVGEGVRLQIQDLCVAGEGVRVRRASLSVRPGEILGLAGLLGSGASTLLLALGGAAKGPVAGAVRLDGKRVWLRSPRSAIAQGVVHLSADRGDTVLGAMSVRDNAMLSSLRHYSSLGVLRPSLATADIERHGGLLNLKAASLDADAGEMSGGNQQKVALMRCLLVKPRVLLLDEPTRGIDVGAKADVYGLIRELSGQGVAIVLSSTELDELAVLCHRVFVMARGRIVAEVSGAALEREQLLAKVMEGAA
jgi:ABC-type sugar transport system ATPase subunit